MSSLKIVHATSNVLTNGRQRNRQCEIKNFKLSFSPTFQEITITKTIEKRVTKDFFDEVRALLMASKTRSRTKSPSLRLIDWTVTNYAKENPIILKTGKSTINIFNSYKSELAVWRRRCFDPFRRKEHIQFLDRFAMNIDAPASKKNWASVETRISEAEKQTWFDPGKHLIDTTLAQLNFLMWAWSIGLLRFCQENKKLIEAHQNAALSKSKKRKSHDLKNPQTTVKKLKKEAKKRRELSPSAKLLCQIVKSSNKPQSFVFSKKN